PRCNERRGRSPRPPASAHAPAGGGPRFSPCRQGRRRGTMGQASPERRGAPMSAFHCTKCGTLMQAPAPGSSGACPNCGQLLQTPAAPDSPPRRSGRWDGPEADDAPYGRPRHLPHSGLGIASFIIGLVVVVIVLLMILLIGVLAA